VDCQDGCPTDPAKSAAGSCGCGIADADLDADGVIDCLESSIPPAATPTPAASATPTGTPLPTDITGYVPAVATLERGSRGQLSINIPSASLGVTVLHYRVKTITKRTIGGVLTGFKSGQYRATYQIVSVDGQTSLASPASNRVTVR
jgi:hypothetical protein